MLVDNVRALEVQRVGGEDCVLQHALGSAQHGERREAAHEDRTLLRLAVIVHGAVALEEHEGLAAPRAVKGLDAEAAEAVLAREIGARGHGQREQLGGRGQNVGAIEVRDAVHERRLHVEYDRDLGVEQSLERHAAHRALDQHDVGLEGHDLVDENAHVLGLLLHERVEDRDAALNVLGLETAAEEQHARVRDRVAHLLVRNVLGERQAVHEVALAHRAAGHLLDLDVLENVDLGLVVRQPRLAQRHADLVDAQQRQSPNGRHPLDAQALLEHLLYDQLVQVLLAQVTNVVQHGPRFDRLAWCW